MTRWNVPALGRWMPVSVLMVPAGLPGCVSDRQVRPEFIANTRLGPATIAVAPALNLSGSGDFDPSRFADLMASELSHADGISVIPVSRVMAFLTGAGAGTVETPGQALELVERLGADAILVFAVVEYDPYDPPSIGITAQLYGSRPESGVRSVDAIALSRQARLAAAPRLRPPRGLLAQTQRVFDASHDFVVEDIKRFAARRNADRSPYGWRRYVVNQQEFIRYCCHATIRALLDGRNESVHPGVGALQVQGRKP